MSAIDDLKFFEGLRLVVYDDATGKAITEDTTVIGHPTIGYGRALDTTGITSIEALYLLENSVAKIDAWLLNSYKWYANLSDVRKNVVINMVYNLGLPGFKEFKEFITCAELQDYEGAGNAILNSLAARQLPKRYQWLSENFANNQQFPYPK